jgi:hypothetical protein
VGARPCATLMLVLPHEVNGQLVYPITLIGDRDTGDALSFVDHPRHRKVWEAVLDEAQTLLDDLCGTEPDQP